VARRLREDVSAAIWQGGPVQASAGVRLIAPDDFDRQVVHELDGLNLDRLDIDCEAWEHPAPDLLSAAFDEQPVEETLSSRLLKSNCPVTGQPDWACCATSSAFAVTTTSTSTAWSACSPISGSAAGPPG
jgi:7-cyano-7-deazaguanine reductase